MKFILNKDKLKIENFTINKSGSIKYYKAEVEFDETWNGLSIEAILIKENEEKGIAIAVIDNTFYIDQNLSGKYLIGFIGYTIEDDVKTYQISSELKPIQFVKGAGEIKTDEEEIPTPSEWEIYLAQVQEFMNNGNEIINQASNLNVELEGTILTITDKEGIEKSVDTKGEDGEDGYTPQKGVDYWTNADKTEMETDVITDITPILNNKADKSEIPDVSDFITKDVNNLVNYELKTNTGSSISFTINSSTYEATVRLKNSAGTVLSSETIDLPLETMVIGASYDSTTKEIVLTLKNGTTTRFSVADLVSGLQTEITSSNKLSSDLVDDTNNTNKFVTTAEKTTWNNKSDFSGNYEDLSNKPTIPTVPTNVSAFTNDAGYLTQHQDISGKEDKSNKVTSISSLSTDIEYPSAKCVYDLVGDIESILTTITTGGGVS